MVIKGDKKFIGELSRLWKVVFSDNDKFINLFFDKQYNRCETFCYEEDGKVVSAFYLLPCNISFGGQIFCGRYLYAAATYPEYRGKKLMSKLINEAQSYCEKQGVDFISLLPAEESLYGYYERFGFKEAMYRFESVIKSDCTQSIVLSKINNGEELLEYRNNYCKDRLIFGAQELEFIIEAMKFYGSQFLKYEDCYAVINKEDNEIYEFIGEDISKINNFIGYLNDEVRISSPYDLNLYGESEKKKFGMIYPINDILNDCADIYMNLGLD